MRKFIYAALGILALAIAVPPAVSQDVRNTYIGIAAQIADGILTNAKLANMANSTTKCRTTSGTGVPEDCTAAQLAAIVNSDATAWSTYTPTITCSGGTTLTSTTTLSGRYKFLQGKTAIVQVRLVPNVIGTCVSFMIFSLPPSGTVNATGADYIGNAANLSTNTSLLFFADSGANGILMFQTPITTQIYVGTITYELN